MKIRVVEDYDSLSRTAAAIVADALNAPSPHVVMPATGRTPTGAYQQLAHRRRSGELDSSGLTLVQLDEYLDLEPHDRRSLFEWMKQLLIDPLEIPVERIVQFDADHGDVALTCRRYEHAVRRLGGIDLAVLGLGPNGHLGFNEPPAGPDARTRVVPLTPASIESNAHYWGSRSLVPTRAFTAGMDLIVTARKILLLVSGSHKSEVLQRMMKGDITDELPASYLRLAPDVTVIADRAAWPWDHEDVAIGDEVTV